MLSQSDIDKIEEMAMKQRKSNDLGEVSPIGEDIFNIIQNIYNSYILLYPLNTKKVAGFTRKRDNNIQIFINTSFNMDFQIFAAAHELYHLIDFSRKNQDDFIVCNDKEDINENIDINNININEQKANYFSAAFLLPKCVVEKRFKKLKDDHNSEDIYVEMIKLQYEFEVPFKTALKRLKELKIINDAEFNQIALFENDNFKYYKMMDDSIGERINKLQTPNYRIYDSLNSPKCAVDLYKHSKISFNKMKKILDKYKKNIDDFNIKEESHKPFDLSIFDDALTGDKNDD